MHTDTTAAVTALPPIERRSPGRDNPRPRFDPDAWLRECTLVDGRRIMIDKRAIGFICQGNAGEDGKPATIIGWKGPAKPVPVRDDYDTLRDWWRGLGARNGGAS